MKTLMLKTLSLFFLFSGGIAVYGQQSQSEVPGDLFSLEGALELFKKSASPEEFERLLNSPNSRVNNLDLNGDGNIDYIRVIDRNEGNVHVFILQSIISDTESQDVAVIELEKLANGKAVLQIIGDEDVYGIETIIEPTQEVKVYAGANTARTVVNVWTWPSVQYVYSPYYSAWISPWSWGLWPMWWSTWAPVAYYDYYPWWQPYRSYYSVCYSPRIVYAHQIYHSYRTTSVVVYNRHRTQITHYRSQHGNNGNAYAYGHRRDHGNGNGNANGYGNNRSYERQKNRPQDTPTSTVRQHSEQSVKRNSHSYTNSNSQRQSRPDFNKKDLRSSNETKVSRNNPNISKRNSEMQQRRSDGSGNNRNSQQYIPPSYKAQKSHSEGGSGMNRSSGQNHGGSRSHRGGERNK